MSAAIEEKHTEDCWYEDDAQLDMGENDDKLCIEGGPVVSTPSKFVEFSMRLPVNGQLEPFTFKDREYIRAMYDTPARRKLILAGRQCEKTIRLQSVIVEYNGNLIRAMDVKVGDSLATMATDGARMTTGEVSWVSKWYTKPCLKITTRQGHTIEVHTEHPVRTWDAWIKAEDLKIKQKIAAVRRCGVFTGVHQLPRSRIVLTAYHLNAENWVIPSWVFDLNREDTALFINRLWSAEGHVKRVDDSIYDIVYSSVSETLTLQIQSLLWKFGIPSSIRKSTLKIYEGMDEQQWLLQVETQKGVCCFLRDIGVYGKSECIPIPDPDSNDNRDTLPREIEEDIRRIIESGGEDWHLKLAEVDDIGLYLKPKYLLTYENLRKYVDYFRSNTKYDQELVEKLALHLDTDLFWDEIVSIEDIGEQTCIDFQVEDTHNFVTDGIITHNSTLLGNISLTYISMIPGFRVLYVSPSHTQTKVFSRDRIKEPIETSKVLRSFTSSKLLANVLEKKFLNRSQITLRFAFLNADRCRGIAADLVLIDEFQDVLLDNIPVIEECASHSCWKMFSYSGTPKSLDGTLEYYWTHYSTQNEWVVPCRRHGVPRDPGSWHWNVLDEDNIGLDGLICDRCGHPISASDDKAQWASLNPNPKVLKPHDGYRIPQLMVPWIDWGDIIHKQRNYSRAKFYNEVLGRSYDSGTRPLTRQDLVDNCNPALSMRHYKKVAEKYSHSRPIFMGIDWGCHDEETRILTQRGFVHFCDLTDNDMVAQFNSLTREMSFTKPEVRTVRAWDGELLHFKDKNTDMMLTPTHRMLTRDQNTDKWKVQSAGEVADCVGETSFVGHVQWCNGDVSTFTLPYASSDPLNCIFSMDDWLERLGRYLSDESVGSTENELFDQWVKDNISDNCDDRRVPRQFMSLSMRQLSILFRAITTRSYSERYYVSMSKGLCEDLQEMCIRLGLCCTVSLHASANEGRKEQWKASWSPGQDHVFNFTRDGTKIPYKGKVYCCKVPTGFIVTERNGRIAYQGNTGEESYTVMTLGGYFPWDPDKFTYFYVHRFTGPDSEPKRQLKVIIDTARLFNVGWIGVDYGGGFWPNDVLVRTFGADKVKRYQWLGQTKVKMKYDGRLGVPRFLCHRTEVMSDYFNAIKRRNVFRFPRWEEFEDPFSYDFLNIFSEYNERMRINIYKHAPGCPDDTTHACIYAFLVSFFHIRRADVILPEMEISQSSALDDPDDWDITSTPHGNRTEVPSEWYEEG